MHSTINVSPQNVKTVMSAPSITTKVIDRDSYLAQLAQIVEQTSTRGRVTGRLSRARSKQLRNVSLVSAVSVKNGHRTNRSSHAIHVVKVHTDDLARFRCMAPLAGYCNSHD